VGIHPIVFFSRPINITLTKIGSLATDVEGADKGRNVMKTQTVQNQSETNGMTASNKEFIQRRAYEIYMRRGQAPGHELEDWLQAEREAKTAAKPKVAANEPLRAAAG